MSNKLKLRLTQDQANLILLGLDEIISKEEHGSERIEVADSIRNALYREQDVIIKKILDKMNY
jgi:hypothetical protein